jgi:hypothetical protein
MNPHPLRVRDYLGHMLDAVRQIQEYARGKSAESFISDRLLQDAVIRNFEILGEASRIFSTRLPMQLRGSPEFRLRPSTVCATSFRMGISPSISTLFGR